MTNDHVLCGVIAVAAMVAVANASLFGISMKQPSSLVSVSPFTGKMTPLGSPLQKELSAQQLSTIDVKRQIYYVLEFNETTKECNLIGLSVTNGDVKVDIQIDVQESMFVGVDQGVAVDPNTGVVVISAHDSSVLGHHVFSVNPWGTTPSKITSIAKIPAPAVSLLGGCSTLDWDLGVFYAPMVMPKATETEAERVIREQREKEAHRLNVSMPVYKRNMDGSVTYVRGGEAPPPPAPPFQVELMSVFYKGEKAGKVAPVKLPANMGTLAYDFHTKSVVGFSGKATANGGYEKTLASFKTIDMGVTYTFKTIGAVAKYVGEMGPISTLNSGTRSHFSMLQPAAPPWQPSDGCAATGFPCKAGTSCCRMPPGGPACFNVPSCSAMHNMPNISAPFFLVELNLDTADVVGSPPPICSIAGGDCPWSLESTENLDENSMVDDVAMM